MVFTLPQIGRTAPPPVTVEPRPSTPRALKMAQVPQYAETCHADVASQGVSALLQLVAPLPPATSPAVRSFAGALTPTAHSSATLTHLEKELGRRGVDACVDIVRVRARDAAAYRALAGPISAARTALRDGMRVGSLSAVDVAARTPEVWLCMARAAVRSHVTARLWGSTAQAWWMSAPSRARLDKALDAARTWTDPLNDQERRALVRTLKWHMLRGIGDVQASSAAPFWHTGAPYTGAAARQLADAIHAAAYTELRTSPDARDERSQVLRASELALQLAPPETA